MYDIVIIAVTAWLALYFMVVRPKSKALAQRQQEQSSTTAGDWVLLQSGLHAYVKAVSEKNITVVLAQNCNTNMIYSKTAIIRRLSAPPGELT